MVFYSENQKLSESCHQIKIGVRMVLNSLIKLLLLLLLLLPYFADIFTHNTVILNTILVLTLLIIYSIVVIINYVRL